MTSVLNGFTDVTKKSYIMAQAPGTSHIYSYATSYNSATYTWSGALTAIDFTVAPYSTYNAAGIVLRETGKKLYAGANPGVDRYMVGVFIIDQDGNNVSGDLGSMYIDPNCSVFAQFNGQRPTYIPTAEDDLAGPGLDLGNPVYTRGDITTVNGNIAASSGSILSGSATAGIGYSTGAGATVTQITSLTTGVTINAACGRIVTFGATNVNGNTAAIFRVTNSVVTANDNVITTVAVNPNTAFVVSVCGVGAGYFDVAVLNSTATNPLSTGGAFTINFAVIKSVIA